MRKVVKSHAELIDFARSMLLREGFSENEIFVEFVVYPPEYPRKQFSHGVFYYRIDAVGIDNERIWAVECGSIRYPKLRELKEIFDKVLHIPYPYELEVLNLSADMET